jgi:hypothetical protein
MSGIEHLSRGIIEDLGRRLPGQRKTQREKLGLLVATMLDVRSANLMDLAASLPRATGRVDMRYQWIERLLANPRVDVDGVMAPYAKAAVAAVAATGQALVLMIDQTQASARHQVLMVSLHAGGRALPVAWRVCQTKGAIGFAVQQELLRQVAALLPEGLAVVLMGDRFYGSPELIALCRALGWDYRLRLKSNLIVIEEGGETTTGECAARGDHLLADIGLTQKNIPTNIAIVHEPGHPEPWIIAMGRKPSAYKALDYGLRWGIEAMFSDFKTRGFGLEDTQIRYPERLARLILVMALALHWAVSTGMWDTANNAVPAEKKTSPRDRKSSPEA